MASILFTLQGANWQRSGGNGDKPRPISRPKEVNTKAPKSAAELAARKSRLKRR